MKTTDPIADMLTRIRNATVARKPDADVPYSKMKIAIAKIPIQVPLGVDISQADGQVRVKGPKGELSQRIPAGIQLAMNDGVMEVTRENEEASTRALHGLIRSLVANMVIGVTTGFTKT